MFSKLYSMHGSFILIFHSHKFGWGASQNGANRPNDSKAFIGLIVAARCKPAEKEIGG